MKKFLIIAFAGCMLLSSAAEETLDYYLPSDTQYNNKIPTPGSVIGHNLGEWLITHDKLIQYMQTIAEVSDRAKVEIYGYSYEARPLMHLIFTSPDNLEKLDQLKVQHNQLCDPAASGALDIKDMPLVVTLGYSVHGNETSGANSALLTAYYLAAAEGPEVEQLLEQTIILVDPCLNPDGLTRFATWGNMHKSQMVSSDENNRGFDEVWPGGRTNHYWYDLNRDYLLLTNPETRGRVKKIHEWKPNIMTDHHEMGSSSTFFFQPGVPSRNNPHVPPRNYELTRSIGAYHARALDQIGSYYFSEEVFDDFYLGKGSAYPDINGGVGILFEQAGVRGFKRQTDKGVLTFPFAIRNQFTVTLSTLQASADMRIQLLEYMRDFYRSAWEEAGNDMVKAYIFAAPEDAGRTHEFLRILKGHKIDVYRITSAYSNESFRYEPDFAYVIPLEQQQYRLIKALFEPQKEFEDSTFYDVSTWTLPYSFNMHFSPVNSSRTLNELLGEKVQDQTRAGGTVHGSGNPVAWAFRWDDFYAPLVLSRLLSEGLDARVTTNPFSYNDDGVAVSFDYGTIIIPTHQQTAEPDQIRKRIESLSNETGIDFFALQTGWTPAGNDLGSSSFRNIMAPKILMLIGDGTSSRDAGEIWHLFDTRYQTSITMVEAGRFNRMELSGYTTIIIPGGSPAGLNDAGIENLKSWIRNGGTLVSYKNAARWAVSNELLRLNFKPGADDGTIYPYADRSKAYSKHAISGAIFEVRMDLTHPLSYGYHDSRLPVFKSGSTAAELPENPYASPIIYCQDPLLSGYASQENIDRIKESPFIVTQGYGRGTVIAILDDTNFRGVWYGTNKIFVNAVFFGNLIGGSSRYYE